MPSLLIEVVSINEAARHDAESGMRSVEEETEAEDADSLMTLLLSAVALGRYRTRG
jgi:hypothetical protein